jgi:glycosyltransferase involved in cell wall biosynthesis
MSRRGLRHLHVHFANNGADIARLVTTVGTAVDGEDVRWTWSLMMHGSTEFEDRAQHDLPSKFASAVAVACISDYTRSQVMRDLPPRDWGKVRLVRTSVDNVRFRPAETGRVRAADEPLRIVTVGRLVPVKGIPLLIEGLEQMAAEGVHASLTVVGSGPLADDLTALVQHKGLQEVVQFTGAMSQDHLPELYRDHDVFCLPSFNEGIPVVIMEAMASGLAVVTTAITGIPELVRDGETGRLVTAGRADQLAQVLAELAGDPAECRRLGERARLAVVRDHDAETNAHLLLDLLEDLVPRA